MKPDLELDVVIKQLRVIGPCQRGEFGGHTTFQMQTRRGQMQIKAGLRLRAHARYAFSRIWDRSNLGPRQV